MANRMRLMPKNQPTHSRHIRNPPSILSQANVFLDMSPPKTHRPGALDLEFAGHRAPSGHSVLDSERISVWGRSSSLSDGPIWSRTSRNRRTETVTPEVAVEIAMRLEQHHRCSVSDQQHGQHRSGATRRRRCNSECPTPVRSRHPLARIRRGCPAPPAHGLTRR